MFVVSGLVYASFQRCGLLFGATLRAGVIDGPRAGARRDGFGDGR